MKALLTYLCLWKPWEGISLQTGKVRVDAGKRSLGLGQYLMPIQQTEFSWFNRFSQAKTSNCLLMHILVLRHDSHHMHFSLFMKRKIVSWLLWSSIINFNGSKIIASFMDCIKGNIQYSNSEITFFLEQQFYYTVSLKLAFRFHINNVISLSL